MRRRSPRRCWRASRPARSWPPDSRSLRARWAWCRTPCSGCARRRSSIWTRSASRRWSPGTPDLRPVPPGGMTPTEAGRAGTYDVPMVRFLPAEVRVRVPATSANLGPGFDALGLALGRYDEVSARATDAGIRVTVDGEGAGDLPTDGEHLVVRCMMATFDRLGGRPAGVDVSCRNSIPQARGLGSSSAAIVAGILAGPALVLDRSA